MKNTLRDHKLDFKKLEDDRIEITYGFILNVISIVCFILGQMIAYYFLNVDLDTCISVGIGLISGYLIKVGIG